MHLWSQCGVYPDPVAHFGGELQGNQLNCLGGEISCLGEISPPPQGPEGNTVFLVMLLLLQEAEPHF